MFLSPIHVILDYMNILSTVAKVPADPLTLAKSSQKFYGNLVIGSILNHLSNAGDLEAWDLVDEIFVNNFY